MKISKSKQELARIISENGGWRDGADTSAQSKSDNAISFYCDAAYRDGDRWWGRHITGGDIAQSLLLQNWHQTILSREEYFYLYPEPDADGWIEWNGGKCPVDGDEFVVCKVRSGRGWRNGKSIMAKVLRWRHTGGIADIIAYRLSKPEQAGAADKLSSEAVSAAKIALMSDSIEELVRKPTIEQLAAEYRNAKDYAERKQEEADDAKADADARLAELVAAGKALGLVLSVAPVQKYTGTFYNAELGEAPHYGKNTRDAVCDGCGKRYGEHYGDRCKSGGER